MNAVHFFYYKVSPDIVGIRLAENEDQINKIAYPEQPESKHPDKTRTDLSLVETMYSEPAKEQAQEKRYPLVLRTSQRNSADIVVDVVIVIAVVDDYRLTALCAAELLDLPAAVGAYNGICRDNLSAMLAEFCRTVYRLTIVTLGHCLLRVGLICGRLLVSLPVVYLLRHTLRVLHRLHRRNRLCVSLLIRL